MSCVTSLNQAEDKTWVGRTEDRRTVTFDNLKQYKAYVQSIDKCQPVQAWSPGQNTTETGFKEFTPRDSLNQAKYDAMSVTWQGTDSSDAAIARGEYSLDTAADTRKQLREQKPAPVAAVQPAPTSCVVQ
uniref:Uncharacterized protein n=1 Tax=viral metagenome TaxID=1070528 RepID=A0A6C0J5A9_9ZZZZ